MNIVHAAQRVGIFIDVQNVYHSSKHLYNSRVNFKEMVRHLASKRDIIRALAYVVKSDTVIPKEEWGARPEVVKGESMFFEALRKAGIELRVKNLQIYPGGIKKADWDVGLAVDAIRMANSLDIIIIVTGDGDFIPLVEYLKWGLGKQVEVAAFGRSSSAKLKEVADVFVELDKVPRILLKSRKRN